MATKRRQRLSQQRFQTGVVGLQTGVQKAVLVKQPVTLTQHGTGPVVRLDHPTAPIQVNDADPGVVEQLAEGAVQGFGADHHPTDLHELPDMRQQTMDHLELGGVPAACFNGVGKGPDDTRVVRPVQARVQAVLGAGVAHALVVRR